MAVVWLLGPWGCGGGEPEQAPHCWSHPHPGLKASFLLQSPCLLEEGSHPKGLEALLSFSSFHA